MQQVQLLFYLLLTSLIFAQQKDSCYAGVYITQDDFLQNRLSHKVNKDAKGYKFEFPSPADWKLEIKIVTPDTTLKFKAGSIYGYYECGSVFRYSAGGELYAPEDFYKIEDAKGLIIYSSVYVGGSELFYSLSLTSPIHRLKLKNLETDFGDHSEFVKAAKCLNKQDEPGDIDQRDSLGNFIINKLYVKMAKK